LSRSEKDFWLGLGSFWDDFENRREVELYWKGMLEAFSESSTNVYQHYLMQYPLYNPDVWERKHLEFDLIFSGQENNEVSPFYFSTDYEGIASIPVLSGIETGEVLVENLDYEIVNSNKIHLLNGYPSTVYNDYLYDGETFYAEKSYFSDPVSYSLNRKLSNIEAMTIEDDSYFPHTLNLKAIVEPISLSGPYSDKDLIYVTAEDKYYEARMNSSGTVETVEITYSQSYKYRIEKIKLIKYMGWALFYLKKSKPSVKTYKWIYNILYNEPFAYEGGIASVNGNECTIGSYTYYLDPDSGFTWDIDGETIERFQPLLGNVEIHDMVSNEALLESTFGPIEKYKSFILNVTSSENSSYLQQVIDDFKSKNLDKNLRIEYSIQSGP
jgi:hypothetical protein